MDEIGWGEFGFIVEIAVKATVNFLSFHSHVTCFNIQSIYSLNSC